MDATPISFDTAIPLGAMPGDERAFADLLPLAEPAARKWAALHEAGFVVAALAGVIDTSPSPAVMGFTDALRLAPRWRQELAAQGVEDLIAIMEPGLAALVAIQRRGADAAAPARALWQEFVAARDAVAMMVAEAG